MIQGGSIIIADFEDMWGNVTNVGLGEHAVRINAPPMLFDKRGNILRYADFEHSTPNYEIELEPLPPAVSTATATRSTDVCLTGNYSMKMFSPDATNVPFLRIRTSDFHEKTVGAQLVFSLDDLNGIIYFKIGRYIGTNLEMFMISYEPFTGQIILYTASGWPVLGIVSKYTGKYIFSTFKLVGDFETGKYNKLLILGTEYDLSTHSCYIFAQPPPIIPPHLLIEVYYIGFTGASTMYIDNVIVTENEKILS